MAKSDIPSGSIDPTSKNTTQQRNVVSLFKSPHPVGCCFNPRKSNDEQRSHVPTFQIRKLCFWGSARNIVAFPSPKSSPQHYFQQVGCYIHRRGMQISWTTPQSFSRRNSMITMKKRRQMEDFSWSVTLRRQTATSTVEENGNVMDEAEMNEWMKVEPITVNKKTSRRPVIKESWFGVWAKRLDNDRYLPGCCPLCCFCNVTI